MATTKKSKKSTIKPHKKAAKKVSKKSMKSFKISREPMPFMTFKITDQTIYWSILLLLIVALFVWVLRIQLDITSLLG